MIYLDNASTTMPDPEVVEAMLPYLTSAYGNPGTLYQLGRDAKLAIDKARKQVSQNKLYLLPVERKQTTWSFIRS